MPELPEVEIVRRGLVCAMEGAAFSKVTLRRAGLRFPFADDFVERLEGRRIDRLSRRAKYIVASLDDGATLAIHLGMTGRFTVTHDETTQTPGEFYYGHGADPRHDHVTFEMSNGDTIQYNDVRRFGYMTLIDRGGLDRHPLFSGLGVEPLSEGLSADYLVERAQGKTVSVKSFLMDQRIVAGLGNIYVCESLFRAKLQPDKKADELFAGKRGQTNARNLSLAIKAVLTDALLAGGSSFRDYRHADGTSGAFQDKFLVYGRKGELCLSGCGAMIERLVQQGRSTFYCPQCQKTTRGKRHDVRDHPLRKEKQSRAHNA